MPCDDCSRTESCPPCPYLPDPDECRCGPGETCGHCFESKGSAGSSTECPVVRTEGGHCFQHPDSKCCGCGEPKPALMCTCGHSRRWHPKTNGGACVGDNCLDCVEFRCDHSRCDWKPREDKPTTVLFERYEPPMTPEEEEQAPEDERPPLHPDDDHTHRPKYFGPNAGTRCVDCNMPMPPQPERRPPYAVAYSVGGHLYEVAIPGDASVRAVDGALVITHALGSVAGIVQTAPLPSGGQG